MQLMPQASCRLILCALPVPQHRLDTRHDAAPLMFFFTGGHCIMLFFMHEVFPYLRRLRARCKRPGRRSSCPVRLLVWAPYPFVIFLKYVLLPGLLRSVYSVFAATEAMPLTSLPLLRAAVPNCVRSLSIALCTEVLRGGPCTQSLYRPDCFLLAAFRSSFWMFSWI